jgi:hypothetical protein
MRMYGGIGIACLIIVGISAVLATMSYTDTRIPLDVIGFVALVFGLFSIVFFKIDDIEQGMKAK